MGTNWKQTRQFAIIAIIILLAAISPPVQAQGSEFFEPFEDPALPGWDRSPGAAVMDGILRIEPGNFAIHPGEWGEMEAHVMMKLEGSGEVFFTYRMGDGSDYRLVFGTNYLILFREYFHGGDGSINSLGSTEPLPAPLGDWFHLTILSRGREQFILINNQVVFEVIEVDTAFPGGIGFEAHGEMSLEVEELTIIPLGEGSPLEGEAAPIEAEDPATTEATAPELDPQQSGDLNWVRTGGPLGGLGYDVRMDPENPEVMYVTDAYAGVFKSMDGGKTWAPSNSGIDVRGGSSGDAIPIFCLTIDPNDRQTIWAGTQNVRGLYKSENGGESWVMKVNGIQERDGITFRGIAIDPTDSQTIYAAAEIASWNWAGKEILGREFDRVKGVVYKTTDGGENWTAVWRGDNLARYILIDPRNTDVIYVSTGIFDREAANSDHTKDQPGGVGVLKSIDGGQTWNQINEGITNLYIGTLFMHPNNPDILLAGASNNAFAKGAGIFITSDGGEHWEKVLDIDVQSVEISTSNPLIAYAGNAAFIYMSTNGGWNWQSTVNISEETMGWGAPGVEAGFPIDFQVDPRDPTKIFANNYLGGNFFSEDGGVTWVDASRGYSGAQVRAIAISSDAPGKVFAAARSGIFGSDDGGSHWYGLNFPQAHGLEWNAVSVDPENTNHLLAANNWNGCVWSSFDGGRGWDMIETNLPALQAWRVIIFSQSNPSIVYAGSSGFYSGGSFDNSMPASGIFRSDDGGKTWDEANDVNTKSAQITGLAVHPEDPLIVYAASPTFGVLKTTDGGASWQKLEQLGQNLRPLSVAANPHQPDLVLAGMIFGGLYRSEDAGETWSKISAGLPPEAMITSILFHPVNSDVIFLSDTFSGVYRSTDMGITWQGLSESLRTRAVNNLAISADGWHLYAATEGEGVFRLDLNGQPPESMVPPEADTALGQPVDLGADQPQQEEELQLEKPEDSRPSDQEEVEAQMQTLFIVLAGSLILLAGIFVVFEIARKRR